MSEPRDRSASEDPLRSLFRQAGEFGQGRSVADPAVNITERGMRAQRRRMAALAVGVLARIGPMTWGAVRHRRASGVPGARRGR
ncbi:hypothetical protein ACIQVA_36265 [Streptomyces microflavus]|uniref:hypothetical protein n=1 Tax=Streptomyces microflavus TaxID=1919 RepID=UPI0037FAD35C